MNQDEILIDPILSNLNNNHNQNLLDGNILIGEEGGLDLIQVDNNFNNNKGKEREEEEQQQVNINIHSNDSETNNNNNQPKPKSRKLPSTTPKQPKPSPADSTSSVKRHWSPAEDALLISIVEKNNAKNWTKIAKELGGGRSGPSCTARWFRVGGSKEENRGKGRMINGDPLLNNNEGGGEAREGGEGEDLMLVVDENVDRALVASTSNIPPSNKKKWSKWQPSEDIELMALIEKHGPKDWHFISRQLSTIRTDDSCCGRWTHYLAPKQKEMEGGMDAIDLRTKHPSKSNNSSSNPRWTQEEDQQLIQLKTKSDQIRKNNDNNNNNHSNGRNKSQKLETGLTLNWATIGSRMIPARSAGSVRARWVQHVAKVAASASSGDGASGSGSGSGGGEKEQVNHQVEQREEGEDFLVPSNLNHHNLPSTSSSSSSSSLLHPSHHDLNHLQQQQLHHNPYHLPDEIFVNNNILLHHHHNNNNNNTLSEVKGKGKEKVVLDNNNRVDDEMLNHSSELEVLTSEGLLSILAQFPNQLVQQQHSQHVHQELLPEISTPTTVAGTEEEAGVANGNSNGKRAVVEEQHEDERERETKKVRLD